MSKIFWKAFSLFIVVFMIFTFLGGCSNEAEKQLQSTTPSNQENTSTKEETAKPVTIKYFSGSSVNKVELEEAIGDFNKKFPHITVEPIIISGADFAPRVQTAIVAGEQVDVIEMGSTSLERQSAKEIYVPLDDLLKEAGIDAKKEYGDYINQFTVDGQIYGLPKYLAAAGVWYNKKHFDEAGIPYPAADWTWDEFFEIAKKLTKKDENGNVERFGAFNWAFAPNGITGTMFDLAFYGGYSFINSDGTINSLQHPTFKKAVQYYYDATLVDHSMPTIAEITAEKYHYMYDMYKGKWSMLISGRNAALFLDIHRNNGQLTAEEDDADTYQLAYLPKWDKNAPGKLAIDTAGGDIICKNTIDKKAAFEFIRWHTTDCLVLSSKVAHRLPAARSLDVNTLISNWRYYKNKDGQIVEGKDRTDLYKSMLDPEITPIFNENTYKYGYSGVLKEDIEKELSLLFAGEKKDIDKTLADIDVTAKKVYERETKK